MYDIHDIAKYIIAKSDNVGDLITNKKLQKLLYYIKAWGLVYFHEQGGVLSEPFEAWVHGPVCRDVYNSFKSFGYQPLSIDYAGLSSSEYITYFKETHCIDEVHTSMLALVDAVFNKYARLTSFDLELLSHSEEPWLAARKGLSPIETGNNVIDEDLMYRYYSKKLADA